MLRKGILFAKGGIFVQMRGLAISMGIGVAAGAVAAMMLPKQSAARKLVNKAADKVENAVQTVTDKITKESDM